MKRGLSVALVLAVALVAAGPAAAKYKAKIAGGKLTLTGDRKSDKLTLKLRKGAPGILQVDVGSNGSVEFALRRSRFTQIVVSAGGGTDTVTVSEKNGAFTNTEFTTLNGGLGSDRLTGGSGHETIVGAAGNDVLSGKLGNDLVVGGRGTDTLLLGGGTDAVTWNSGDGNDTVDGQAGADTLSFGGSVAGEGISVTASAGRALVKRNFDNVTVRTDGLEEIVLVAAAGADTLTVGDLSTTDVVTVDAALDVASVGDGAADQVKVLGTNGAETLNASASGSSVLVAGVGAQIIITGPEAANDELHLIGLGEGDTLIGGSLAALIQLTLDGGAGADELLGGNGVDLLIGGTESDVIDGNVGNDTFLMGDGDDLAVWDPGDGSDVIEGQGGDDSMTFNGSAGAEIFTASASGSRLLFQRNLGAIAMDVDDVEHVNLNALAGADTIQVNSLLATDVDSIAVELRVSGISDGATDVVTVTGTSGVDLISVSSVLGIVSIDFAAIHVSVSGSDSSTDSLTVSAGAGADIASASTLSPSILNHLTLNGGSENDILVGSSGADTLNGDTGAGDYCDGGPGTDSATTCETVVNVP